MKTPLAALALALVLAGCGAGVPQSPTYFQDVQPILQANCARCHGADAYEPEIAGFRLDRYVKGDARTLDAWDYRDAIVKHTVEHAAPAMPPGYVLTARQQQILQRWVAQGAPKGTRSNRAPQLELLSPAAGPVTVDQALTVDFRAWDEDGDGLAILLGAREKGSTGGDVLVSGLGGGQREVELDLGVVASKRTYELFAVLDDGFSDDPAANETQVVLLSDLYVDHGDRGTAPAVILTAPNGGQTLIGTTTITWSATDPDPGDVLTLDLDLLRLDASGTPAVVAPIAHGLSNDQQSFSWDTSMVPAVDSRQVPIRYEVRVTATDSGAKNVRSDDSDTPFTIARATGTTTYTWADVQPLFTTYCIKCHGEPARSPALDYFRADKYDAADPVPPVNSDEGIYEVRATVYQKVVVDGSMPPTAEPQPSAADIAKIGDWILGGAPKGGGPANGKPTFTWSVPNSAAITKTTTGTVNLRWSASDPEVLPFSAASISYAEISANTDALANCSASVTGWTPISAVNVPSGSYTWTAPKLGYFCFKGEVTDAAGQTTVAIAGRPVKYSVR